LPLGLAAAGALGVRGPSATFTLPPQAAILPKDASAVMGVDVPRLVASEAYRRFRDHGFPEGAAPWAELTRRTGLDLERDLTSIVAGSSGDGASILLVLGRFERGKLEKALADAPGVQSVEHGPRRVFTWEPRAGRSETAIAVVEDGVLLAGPRRDVEMALDRKAEGGDGVTANRGLMALTARVDPSAAFWICGDQEVMSAAGSLAPQAAGWTVPSITSLVVSGVLDREVRASVVATTADPAAAKGVADMARALLGLLAMQAAQRPELQELASGIEIRQEGAEVRIAAHVSVDTLEKLPATPRPTPSARATPAPARPRATR
jgi:hypothetical protein